MGFYREEKEEWREGREEREWEEETGSGKHDEWFLLQDSKRVIKTEAGDVRVLRSYGGRALDRPLHIGFITMEPRSLFIPQYIDSSLILFVRTGTQLIFCTVYFNFSFFNSFCQLLDNVMDFDWVIGEAKVGLIYKDELAERRLKVGDIYRIPAGSAFYLVNTEEGQRLHIICSIDPSESLGMGAFQVN